MASTSLLLHAYPSRGLLFDNLSTDGSVQVNRLRAAVHLLHGGCAVAVGLASGAVEELAAVARGQDVALVSEGVAPLCAELV